jgi:hypothetical protein
MSHRIDHLVTGFYKTRLVRSGPWVPVEIRYGSPPDPETGEPLDRSPRWMAWMLGNETDPYEIWTRCCSHPIPAAEFQYLMALSSHAKIHAPEMPEADPTKTVDLTRNRPIF